ncbi:MAG: homoserine dehydrogenase [Chloroflexi bacterium]|nr:homoserine dehydrogenase [Chloroflexota bacterium]
MKIALIGAGNVGQGLLQLLRDKGAALATELGLHAQVVAVATRRHGTLYHPQGLDAAGVLDALAAGDLRHYPQSSGLARDWDAARIAREAQADTLIEASPTDLHSGQPALDLCLAAFASGKHVVLANKGPLAVAYHTLTDAARRANKLLRFEATVMGGTPSIRLAQQALAGCVIREARGILNGTTNYILTQMENGTSYVDALAQAQRLGYAEADPSADVDGWDAAGKALILAAALFGTTLRLDQMQVQGIRGLTRDNIFSAHQEGECWKLVARVTPEGGSVQPQRLLISDPLANVKGITNAVTYVTDVLGEVTLVGPGAGGLQTGFALLSDLVDIQRVARH